MRKSISIAILAGGQSSRMGVNKAFSKVGGKPIIERIIDRILPLSDDIMIITNIPSGYAHLNIPLHADIIPGKAALGGVYTGLVKSQHDHTLVLSCDQPFLNVDLIRYLIDLIPDYDVVTPLDHENYPQSMHSIYGKVCIAPIRKRIDADRLKVIGFFEEVRVREVTAQEIDRFDPERHSFVNVNTPEDLAKARQLAVNLDD